MLTDVAVASHVFPAYAGMSLTHGGLHLAVNGFPRLRGDEPYLSPNDLCKLKFSPPTRG